jgi:hypothetical protein
MNIQIPQIIRAAWKFVRPQSASQPTPAHQAEFDF